MRNIVRQGNKDIKELNIMNAPVNFCKCFNDDGGISCNKYRSFHLDSVIQEISKRSGIGKTIFVANEGRYICTSSSLVGFVNNPLGVDLFSISEVTKALSRELKPKGCILSGWHLHDAYNGYYIVQFCYCDDSGNLCYSDELLYRIKTSKFVKYNSESVYIVKTLESYLPGILKSLQGINIPIDLFEVCVASLSLSEEANGVSDIYSYMATGELGYPENRTHTLSGLSIISGYNGFTRHPFLNGKYALLIVQ